MLNKLFASSLLMYGDVHVWLNHSVSVCVWGVCVRSPADSWPAQHVFLPRPLTPETGSNTSDIPITPERYSYTFCLCPDGKTFCGFRFGRKVIFFVGMGIHSISTFLLVFSPSWTFFCCMYFLVGLGNSSSYSSTFVLGTIHDEQVSSFSMSCLCHFSLVVFVF